MELLEGQDPEKKKLIETSDRHKRALEKEVSALAEKSEKMLTNALIIGGSLALTYFLVSSFSGGKKKKRKKKKNKVAQLVSTETNGVETEEEEVNEGPSIISSLGTSVLNHASVLLLNIAKEKLFEYLESRKKDENS